MRTCHQRFLNVDISIRLSTLNCPIVPRGLPADTSFLVCRLSSTLAVANVGLLLCLLWQRSALAANRLWLPSPQPSHNVYAKTWRSMLPSCFRFRLGSTRFNVVFIRSLMCSIVMSSRWWYGSWLLGWRFAVPLEMTTAEVFKFSLSSDFYQNLHQYFFQFNPSNTIAKSWSDSLAFCASHLNCIRYRYCLCSLPNLRYNAMAGMVSSISVATPFSAKSSSNAFPSSSHPFLLANVPNLSLNMDRGELPSKHGRFILAVPSDTNRTGSGRWLWRLLIITNFLSTAFSKSFTFVATVFSKCNTFSLTPVILLLTGSCIFYIFPDVMLSSFSIFDKIVACSFWFASLEASNNLGSNS